jgi:hyperosmotically inducible protein
MRTIRLTAAVLAILAIGTVVGCRSFRTSSPDVSATLSKSLYDAGFRDVTVAQDREKGIVTLGGRVATQNDKYRAESLAKSLAGDQVVADQIAVLPPGLEREVGAVNTDLDQGIEKNLDAALIQNKMHDNVSYAVKNGVVTLTGEVHSEHARKGPELVAAGVPNVHQVVNAIQVVKHRKASSSE